MYKLAEVEVPEGATDKVQTGVLEDNSRRRRWWWPWGKKEIEGGLLELVEPLSVNSRTQLHTRLPI